MLALKVFFNLTSCHFYDQLKMKGMHGRHKWLTIVTRLSRHKQHKMIIIISAPSSNNMPNP